MAAKAKRKVAVVTSSRADYAHLRSLLDELRRRPSVYLQIISLGPHFSPAFGHTGKILEHTKAPAVKQIECLLDSDSDVGMAKTIGLATLGISDALDQLRPDILVVIADRYEMLAPAAVALALRIPIAHIEGGEITVGAIDDTVRSALTKMSHLHFACTRQAAERIADMGEEPWRITFSGSLSLDALRKERLLMRTQLRTKLGFEVSSDTIVCVYHPVTMLPNTLEEAAEVFAAVEEQKRPIVFIYPNADAGSRELIRRTETFAAAHPNARVLVNLEHRVFLSLLKHAGVLIGNSSAGIIESTSLEIPVVNIGIRQRGREHAANVIDVNAEARAIRDAIEVAMSPRFRQSIRALENPYGSGNAARTIADVLTKTALGPKLLFKHAELL
jgi:UDP-hydrolysing UDP-N-acetyl-D-glucosamine 2-epimerase